MVPILEESFRPAPTARHVSSLDCKPQDSPPTRPQIAEGTIRLPGSALFRFKSEGPGVPSH